MDSVAGIRLFIRVVETGSFSRASAGLNITQPTATKHVAALESRLGARLFHRSTRGVTPTEVGLAYYDRCKRIALELEAADNVASLMQGAVGGVLRIGTSVAFGRRVLTPLVLDFMRAHPGLQIDLSFEDRYVDLVQQGIDIAVRMGRLADSSLGARHLGMNPWVVVASPAYLQRRGEPATPADLAEHDALIYSSVQSDERWQFSGGAASTIQGEPLSVPVSGPLRSNNLSALLSAARDGMGIAALPWYVAHASERQGAVRVLLNGWSLPTQEIHAVFPSPKLLPLKVSSFCDFAAQRFGPRWWEMAPSAPLSRAVDG